MNDSLKKGLIFLPPLASKTSEDNEDEEDVILLDVKKVST